MEGEKQGNVKAESAVEAAHRHVARQADLVRRQRQVVRRLANGGYATGRAVLLLQSAEKTLAQFQNELCRLQTHEGAGRSFATAVQSSDGLRRSVQPSAATLAAASSTPPQRAQ